MMNCFIQVLFLTCLCLGCHGNPFLSKILDNKITKKLTRQFSIPNVGTVADSGHSVDCVNYKNPSNIQLSWSPKIVTIGNTVDFSGKLTAVSDLREFVVQLDVWEGSNWNGTRPMFSNTDSVTCDVVKKKYFNTLKCPIKKGDVVQLKYTLNYDSMPADTYSLRIVAYADTKKQLFGCFVAVITFKYPDESANRAGSG